VLSALVVSYFILYANPSYSDMTLRSWIYLSDDSPNLYTGHTINLSVQCFRLVLACLGLRHSVYENKPGDK
jgi:hypothetical protein